MESSSPSKTHSVPPTKFSSDRLCVECKFCSAFGRCQKALSDRYSEIFIGKQACREFK